MFGKECARSVPGARLAAARLRAGQRMPLLSDAQYDRLNELAWVMYVTEDGEEYFGKVGSDFTQWDPPDELTEDDIELLRLSMTELDEDDAAMTSNMEGGAFDGDCGEDSYVDKVASASVVVRDALRDFRVHEHSPALCAYSCSLSGAPRVRGELPSVPYGQVHVHAQRRNSRFLAHQAEVASFFEARRPPMH